MDWMICQSLTLGGYIKTKSYRSSPSPVGYASQKGSRLKRAAKMAEGHNQDLRLGPRWVLVLLNA